MEPARKLVRVVTFENRFSLPQIIEQLQVRLLDHIIEPSHTSDNGVEALLQLVADELSTSQPLTEFWRTRSKNQAEYRTYTKHDA